MATTLKRSAGKITHGTFHVTKRNGSKEPLMFDKIAYRIARLCFNLSGDVDSNKVAQKVIAGLYPGITTSEIDQEAARVAANLVNDHPDYGILAGRLAVVDIHRNTAKKFSEVARLLYDYVNPDTGKHTPRVSKEVVDLAEAHKERIDGAIVQNRDMNFTYFGIKTLERSYLIRLNDVIAESPQHMYMRVALGIHGADIDRAIDTYGLLSMGLLSHASPTMFNSGTPHPQFASCFLLQFADRAPLHDSVAIPDEAMTRVMALMAENTLDASSRAKALLDETLSVAMADRARARDQDSIDAIYETLKRCAVISKTAGGIGLAAHSIRASGTFIAGTNGKSNGLVPMLRVYNSTARYVDQGGNKRPGAIAIYLEPWHADIFEFLKLKELTGAEELRARDLFYALWVPDLFMKRVETGGTWTLMCPHKCPGLAEVWGADFEELYERYEREGRGDRTLPAQELWSEIVSTQIQTGTPYMLYKDNANRSSNHQHLGTIQCSNLCVAGDTHILTKKGYQVIGDIAAPDPEDLAKDKDANIAADRLRDELNERIATLDKRDAELQAENTKTPLTATREALQDVQQQLGALRMQLNRLNEQSNEKASASQARSDRDGKVEVWNGEAWSKVTVRKTGTNRPLLRITTSHGCVLNCTPEHYFILNERDPDTNEHVRVHASALGLGHKLVPSPPVVYPGDEQYAIPDDKAFLHGFVYAYAVLKKGSEIGCLGPRVPSMQIPAMAVVRSMYTEETLQRLGYNENARRKQFPKADHDAVAYLLVDDEKDQKLQTRMLAPVATRKAWAQGFMAGCEQRAHMQGSYALLYRPWLMLRSIGESVRLAPKGRTGLWALTWGDPNEPPVVTAIEDLGVTEDTYCFTEPDRHAGVFEGQLTGQCTEIIEYTAPDEISVCTLASLPLNKFVGVDENQHMVFDFDLLHDVTKKTVVNLNRVIDRNAYALHEMQKSNFRHRPIGIGVQGLADTFCMMRLPWNSDEAALLNRQIFETMYHAALEQTCALAAIDGYYETYPGSPLSEGRLHFDMVGVTPTDLWDWAPLREQLARHGARNSLLLTCMPTASTAQILGNNESIEPFTSNMYTRKVLSGEFQVVNPHLIYDLIDLGLWDDEMVNAIKTHGGSVQNIDRVPQSIKDLYRTVWEIPQRLLVDMAAARGAYIDQSQSFNLHIAHPTYQMVTSAHFYGWRSGLKTGMYYLRSRPAVDPVNIAVGAGAYANKLACARDNPEGCVMCSA